MDGLSNRYWGIRHGQSEANVAGLVVSRPEHGLDRYGLTPVGVEQVSDAVSDLVLDAPLVLASDFLRTRRTAEIAARALGTTVALEPRLRERDFGERELTDAPYEPVWAEDARDSSSRPWGVESADAVAGRIRTLLADCERRWSGRSVVWVSHGDVLQIAETVLRGLPASEHRVSVASWQCAELRRLSP